MEYIKKQILSSIEVKKSILSNELLLSSIQSASRIVLEAYQKGKKTLIAGNGGSAADAQHIAGEFVSRFYFDRPSLASIALTTDTSILTAISNDYGYEKIFSRQIEALGNKEDVFIAISTSGNSKNIIKGIETAKEKGLYVIGLTGLEGGELKNSVNICISVPSNETPRVQESHILIGHIICAFVEKNFFKDYKK
jgi:D-sedoheptulose 7-phosphate isomerase